MATSATSKSGILLGTKGSISNIELKNNIILGFDTAPVYCYSNGSPAIDVMSISHNVFYTNGNSNGVKYDFTPTNLDVSNNIIQDTSFINAAMSDYRLSSGSCAINTGEDVGLMYTGITSDIGAFETSLYYITVDGSNSYVGSWLYPWQNLSYACKEASTSGSIIYVNSGIFYEPSMCNLSPGVNITGDGSSAIIQCTKTFATANGANLDLASIRLVSSTPNTAGNQSISNITIDGSGMTATKAVVVKNRGGVKIHNCYIKDFFSGGLSFINSSIFVTEPPAVYDTGNDVYNCVIDNCGDTDTTWDGGALITMACQKNMLIHDNSLYSNKRDGSHNGNIINGGGRHFLGCKYYNNQSFKPDYIPFWNFHLEMWGNDGGFEIYNNVFTGGDCGRHGRPRLKHW